MEFLKFIPLALLIPIVVLFGFFFRMENDDNAFPILIILATVFVFFPLLVFTTGA